MGRRKAVSKREGEDSGSKRKRRRASSNREGEVKQTELKSTGGVTAAEISKPEPPANSGIVHPLLIPHVIENVFQHIIPPTTATTSQGSAEAESSASVAKNVKNFRLVCKQWKDSATRLYLRNRAPIMSFGNETDSFSNSSEEKLKNFLDVMNSSDLIPIQRYTIETDNQQLMTDFLHICGPDVVELCLSCYTYSRMIFTRETVPDLNLMKLKKLSFTCADARRAVRATHEITSLITGLIELLLSAAKTLHEFQFYEYNCLQETCSQTIIQQFGDSICKQLPKTIKILGLHMSLNDWHWITLADSGLKLEELYLYQAGGEHSMAIRKFFENQAATLKLLEMFAKGVKNRPSPVWDFPRLDELLHLKTDGGFGQRFSFPDTFPKLTSLNICGWKSESTCVELLSPVKKGKLLKEIHLPFLFSQAPLVKKAAKSFPNLSKLHISPSDDISETLKEVFVYFSNLEELHITFPDHVEYNADLIFSGVSENEYLLIKLRRFIRCVRLGVNTFEDADMGDNQHQSSLLNLTRLKKLVITGDGADTILTDFTAHFLFLKMDSLKELRTSIFYMGTKYLDLLREKLTLKIT